MLRHRMLLASREPALRQKVKRLSLALSAQLCEAGDVDLAIADARSGQAGLPEAPHILCLVPAAPAVEYAGLLADPRVNSIIAADVLSDDVLIAAAGKALRGEVFGLAKYLPWGTTVFSMTLGGMDDKNRALEVLLEYAGVAGCRGPVRERLALAADEMMMNALRHGGGGKVSVQYACGGRWFGLAVRDGGGRLTRDRVVEYLCRTPTVETKQSGAGLGLLTIARAATRLAFDLEPGRSTEVVALFDTDPDQKGKLGARSLHVFQAAAQPAAEVNVRSGAPLWAAAAVLLAVASSLGMLYYEKRAAPVAPAAVVCPESPFSPRR